MPELVHTLDLVEFREDVHLQLASVTLSILVEINLQLQKQER